MKAATLNEFLRDESKEIRRGAAIACGTKGDKAHVPELVRLIADIEPAVVQAARAALKALTKEDYGPEVAATPAERTQAVLAWRKWLESQPK